MEYRILEEREIDLAVRVARQVYQLTIEPFCREPEMKRFFLEYVTTERLTQMAGSGQLTMWGAFSGNALCGVGAMQADGHITMLYVLPHEQRRGAGKELLSLMRKYAFAQYGLTYVTVSVTPAWMYPYFERCGFRVIRLDRPVSPLFVPMRAKSDRARDYRTRPMSEKAVTVTVAVFLLAIVLSSAAFALWFWLG